MDLLPKTYQDFGTRQYWSEFFEKRESAFEWYGEYPNVQSIWKEHIPEVTSSVLVVGCGNSAASAQMYDDGYTNIVNIDFVEAVVEEMKSVNQKRGSMRWETMDMTATSFTDREFDVVFDKGALDALYATDSEDDTVAADSMMREVKRVANRYFCITLAQDHIVKKLLENFCTEGWDLTIHQPDPNSFDNSSPLFPFVFVATRLSEDDPQPLDSVTMVLADSEPEPLPSAEVPNTLQSIQNLTSSRHKLRGKLKAHEFVRIELWDGKHEQMNYPRYTATVCDLGRDGAAGSCGVFIVPQGKQHMWQFVSEEGVRQLTEQIGMTRLITVTMHPCHEYASMQHVQDELSSAMEGLVPPSMKPGERIPYLSMEEGIGESWTLVAQVESPYCGSMLVEEQASLGEGNFSIRRLLFASNRDLIQSESRFSTEGGNSVLDPEFLCFDHHKAMAAGLAVVQPALEAGGHLELIGLGSGAFSMFLRHALPSNPLTAVEIDQIVVDLAREQFGLVTDQHTTVVVQDGLEYLMTPPKHAPAVVFIDVDSKDLTTGMSSPPAQFIEEPLLHCIRARLAPGGVLMLNIACRSSILKADVLERLKSVFEHVRELQLDEDVNCVLFCFPEQSPAALATVEELQAQCDRLEENEAFREGVFERLNVTEQLGQMEGVEFQDNAEAKAKRHRSRNNKKKKKK